jgi:predicted nucleic acid-binding protein
MWKVLTEKVAASMVSIWELAVSSIAIGSLLYFPAKNHLAAQWDQIGRIFAFSVIAYFGQNFRLQN